MKPVICTNACTLYYRKPVLEICLTIISVYTTGLKNKKKMRMVVNIIRCNINNSLTSLFVCCCFYTLDAACCTSRVYPTVINHFTSGTYITQFWPRRVWTVRGKKIHPTLLRSKLRDKVYCQIWLSYVHTDGLTSSPTDGIISQGSFTQQLLDHRESGCANLTYIFPMHEKYRIKFFRNRDLNLGPQPTRRKNSNYWATLFQERTFCYEIGR